MNTPDRKSVWINHKVDCLDHGFVRLLDVAGSDREIVAHARTSTQNDAVVREEADDKKLLHYLYKNRHTSPFEMTKLWFEVQLPIFVWRQWVRHRMQNMNEVSGRYSKLPDVFYVPTKWRRQAETNKQSSVDAGDWNPELDLWMGNDFIGSPEASKVLEYRCKELYKTYEAMLKAGVAKEMARMVLPLNIYTRMHVCFDLHNLLHFIRLRDDSHAQSEIQEYGQAVGFFVERCFPWTWEAYKRYKVVVVDMNEVVPFGPSEWNKFTAVI